MLQCSVVTGDHQPRVERGVQQDVAAGGDQSPHHQELRRPASKESSGERRWGEQDCRAEPGQEGTSSEVGQVVPRPDNTAKASTGAGVNENKKLSKSEGTGSSGSGGGSAHKYSRKKVVNTLTSGLTARSKSLEMLISCRTIRAPLNRRVEKTEE
ncbi:hypothetical protein OsI_20447 [Oryza sativa Indica Group]|uniref:Uncharacterized protein n=1 Tax=Oryza sativa subsp. indica TaxID=39946 RepID=B8AZJ1_ORYSI|nr:hypothetical protein OsI_20447 [Oryza sativa Indica Group]